MKDVDSSAHFLLLWRAKHCIIVLHAAQDAGVTGDQINSISILLGASRGLSPNQVGRQEIHQGIRVDHRTSSREYSMSSMSLEPLKYDGIWR